MPDKRVYHLYLSTNTPSGYNFAPANKTNLSNVSWSVDWNRVFGYDLCGRGDTLVKIKLVSKHSAVANLGYDTTLGTVRANFTTNYQQQNNLTVLGLVNTYAPISSANTAFICDTTNNYGVRIRIPNNVSYFNIQLVTQDEQLMSTISGISLPEYEILMSFEIIEDSIQPFDD